jgi:hypothetical protein
MYAAETGKKDESKKKGCNRKGDKKRKSEKGSSIHSFATNAQQQSEAQKCPECNSRTHSLGDCKQFLNLHKDERLARAKKYRVHF